MAIFDWPDILFESFVSFRRPILEGTREGRLRVRRNIGRYLTCKFKLIGKRISKHPQPSKYALAY